MDTLPVGPVTFAADTSDRRLIPAEVAIGSAMSAVKDLGQHELLFEALEKLVEAQIKVGEYVKEMQETRKG